MSQAMSRLRGRVAPVFGLGCFLMLSTVAWAAPEVINISTGNSAISGYTGPYAQVTVTLTSSTTATFDYVGLNNGTQAFLLVDGGSVAANINASSFTLSNLTGTVADGTGFSQATYSNGGAGNEDGIGKFNQTVNSSDSFSDASKEISFTITNNSGTWSSESDVLKTNNNGFLVAAHIGVCTIVSGTSCNQANGALNTGFAGDGGGTVSEVPEPAMITALSGVSGLLVLVAARVRRRARLS